MIKPARIIFISVLTLVVLVLSVSPFVRSQKIPAPARAEPGPCSGNIVGRVVDEQGKSWGNRVCENNPYDTNMKIDFSGGNTYFHGCSGGAYYWTDEVACGEYTMTLTPPEGYKCRKWTLAYVNTYVEREGPGCTAKIAIAGGDPIKAGGFDKLHTSLWFHIEPYTPVNIPNTGVNFNCDFDNTLVCDSINGSFVEPVDSHGVVFTEGKGGKAILNYDTLAYETVNNFNPNKGSVEMWVRPGWNGNDSNRHFFFSYYADENNYLSIEKSENSALRFVVVSPPGDRPEHKWSSNNLWHAVNYDVSDWKADEWHHIKMIWDQTLNDYYLDPTRTFGEIKGYVDGKLVGITTGVWNHIKDTNRFYIGSYAKGYWHANAAIDKLKITSSTQTDIPDRICGNDICEVGEDVNLCSSDCNQFSIPPNEIKPVDTGYDVGLFVMPGFSDTRDDGVYPFDTRYIQEKWDLDNMRSATPVLELGEGAHHQPLKSFLGWYDDANPVFWDWLIKWEMEHGVNLFIFDWYRENDRMFYQDTLEKGFMQSKYADQAKFAVMWINGHGAPNMDYLDENQFKSMVDYVAENYFSKNNYYKINGKPVLFIWSSSDLFFNLGGAEKTKTLLDKMRQWSQEKGHSGLYIIARTDGEGQDENSNWAYNNFVEAYREMGFDGITDYGSYGYDGMDNYIELDNYKVYHEPYEELIEPTKQKYEQVWGLIGDYAPGMKYFPTLSSGHDWSPRRSYMDTKVRTYASPEQFSQMVTNAKEFIDSRDIQPRLITISALSEFAEGGVLQPLEHTQFSYLEALRLSLTCGDNICEGWENYNACPADCQSHAPGDAGGDGDVDEDDLNLLKEDYLGTPVHNTDFNSDGRVDIEDFAILQANYSE